METTIDIIFFWVIAVFGTALAFMFLWAVYYKAKELLLFKRGRNMAHRICRKCGANQEQFELTEGGYSTWWEQVGYEGDNPDCQCHNYSDYYDPS